MSLRNIIILSSPDHKTKISYEGTIALSGIYNTNNYSIQLLEETHSFSALWFLKNIFCLEFCENNTSKTHL